MLPWLIQLGYKTGASVTPPTPPAAIQDGNAGGWPILWSFEIADSRRRRKQRERELERNARQIPEEIGQQIAQLLAEQERKDAERYDLERIQKLADRLMREPTSLPRPILSSVLKAHEERTRNSLEQLERLIQQQVEDEEMSVLIFLLNEG